MKPDALVLFSGGLDSILAARLLMAQGLNILGVHFTSPFFGNAQRVSAWEASYGIPLLAVDIGAQFGVLMRGRPQYGFGKHLNPCIDCKILQLSVARKLMEDLGADFLATGEVLGQRPMSQRREAMNLIQKKAGVGDVLVRPLCALRLEPTVPELAGLVDRDRLLGISGRGRNDQLGLARAWGISDIPTPGGGCKLTEKENSRRYWQVLKYRASLPGYSDAELLGDFQLANLGRQLWRRAGGANYWLAIGRNAQDNKALLAACRDRDATLKLRDQPGPLALAREGASWPGGILAEACALTAAFAPRADSCAPVSIKSSAGKRVVRPAASPEPGAWTLPSWELTREEIRRDRSTEPE